MVAGQPENPRNRRIEITLMRDAALYEAAREERVPTLPSIIDARPDTDL